MGTLITMPCCASSDTNKIAPESGEDYDEPQPSFKNYCGVEFKVDGEGLFNYMKAGCGPLVPALQVLCLLMLVGHCVWGGIVLGDSAVVKQLCGDGLADWTSNVLIVQALVYIAVAAIPFTMRNKHNARITGVVYLALAVAMFVLYLSKFAINVKLLSKATGQDLSCQAMYETTQPSMWAFYQATNALGASGGLFLLIPSIIFLGATQQKCAGIEG